MVPYKYASTKTADGFSLLTISGQLCIHDMPSFEAELMEILQREPAEEAIILNLNAVTQICPEGWTALADFIATCAKEGCLCCVVIDLEPEEGTAKSVLEELAYRKQLQYFLSLADAVGFLVTVPYEEESDESEPASEFVLMI